MIAILYFKSKNALSYFPEIKNVDLKLLNISPKQAPVILCHFGIVSIFLLIFMSLQQLLFYIN